MVNQEKGIERTQTTQPPSSIPHIPFLPFPATSRSRLPTATSTPSLFHLFTHRLQSCFFWFFSIFILFFDFSLLQSTWSWRRPLTEMP